MTARICAGCGGYVEGGMESLCLACKIGLMKQKLSYLPAIKTSDQEAAMIARKTANICANIYVGEFQLSFDCVGVEVCRFALCPMMPPDGSEECTYREHGSCLCPHAKYAALESLRNRLVKELKQSKEDCEG